MTAAKHLLWYLKGTKEMGLKYSRPSNKGPMDRPNQLSGFVDSDWAGCQDTRRSTSGFVLVLNGSAISWKSKRQSVVALSSAEAEFMAASSLVQEVTYARRFLEKLGFPQTSPTLTIVRALLGLRVQSVEVIVPSILICVSIMFMRRYRPRPLSWRLLLVLTM
jgi:hypothetical protein